MKITNISLPTTSGTIAAIEYGFPCTVPTIGLHGWLDNAASFSFIGKQLSASKLISLDLIGHGYSSHRPNNMPYHIWDNLTDLYKLLQTMQLNKVNLIGHSMGAGVAMMFAAIFPEKVNNLMLIDGLAPLTCDISDTPTALAKAITSHNKKNIRPSASYPDMEQAINARMNARWPVSYQAAAALLERGMQQTDTGFVWRHDPRLLLPSLLRFSPEQIQEFVSLVQAKTWVIKGSQGAAELIINNWVPMLSHAKVIEIEGGHHLHMEPDVATKLAAYIDNW